MQIVSNEVHVPRSMQSFNLKKSHDVIIKCTTCVRASHDCHFISLKTSILQRKNMHHYSQVYKQSGLLLSLSGKYQYINILLLQINLSHFLSFLISISFFSYNVYDMKHVRFQNDTNRFLYDTIRFLYGQIHVFTPSKSKTHNKTRILHDTKVAHLHLF